MFSNHHDVINALSNDNISKNDLLEILKKSNLKIMKLYPKIIYVDDYFPSKYVELFFTNLMENFQMKDSQKDIINRYKNLLICKQSDNPESQLIPKQFFRNLEINLRKLTTNSDLNSNTQEDIENEFNNILSSILNNLEQIAKSLKKMCKGQMEFIKLVKSNINLNTNKNMKSKKFSSKKFKKVPVIKGLQLLDNGMNSLASQAAYSLKVHNFDKSGVLLSKLLNYISLKL